MEDEEDVLNGLLVQDQLELSERVSHLEKRVREQQDEIVCLKGAMADVMRRMGQVETTKTQNSILPSKPYLQSPRRTPAGKERPRSVTSESSSARSSAPSSARHPPRGSPSSSVKRWGSMSNSIEDTNGHRTPRSGSQLTSANSKGPAYNEEDRCVRMYLKGRPVPLYVTDDIEEYNLNDPQGKPEQTLSLEWVYGYRGKDTRSNMYPLPTGEVVYFNAAVVVLHDFEHTSQRHYLEHTDDVKCLAVHPNKILIASGQVAGHEKKDGKPHVRIWHSVSLQTLYTIGEKDFERAVCCVAFSDTGYRLLAVDESNNHNLTVWDTSAIHFTDDRRKKPKKIAENKASDEPVAACDFMPGTVDSIVCCGKSQISFWTMEDNKLSKRSGIFEKNDKAKFITCVAFREKNAISGDSNGNIYEWKGNKIVKAVEKAHEGPVFSICVLEDKLLTGGGGKDRMIYEWDLNFERTGRSAQIEERYGAVRMISVDQGKVYVGTVRNCILLSTMELSFTPIVEGHKDELWGLCTFPDKHQFVTCGYEGQVYLWDSMTHKPLKFKQLTEPAHCCAVYKYDEDYIAVIGFRTGKWVSMNLSTLEVFVNGDTKDFEKIVEQQECVEFSPDGSMLAFGNRDNHVYVYEVSKKGTVFKKVGTCKGHSSYITHLDWSADSQTIRTNSGDYEILYWNAKTCKRQKDFNRNLKFATNNCTLSFNTLGIWPDGADGTDINACSTANDVDSNRVIATGDDCGKVNLYEYPSKYHLAVGHDYQAHSSHVTGVKFLFDDSRLISTGGKDMAVMQWILNKTGDEFSVKRDQYNVKN